MQIVSILVATIFILCSTAVEDDLNGSCDSSHRDCTLTKGGTEGMTRPSNDLPLYFDKYYELINHQWSLHPIDENITDAISCSAPFDKVIMDDLLPWKQKGGITYESFNEAKPWGVHYQILDHKLYRQEKCLFEQRCKGVEYYLLKIVDDVPDTELIINVHDWPKSPKHSQAKPVLSFSKDNTYHDIMYPAWTFWCGGPSIATEPMGLGRWDLKRETMIESSKKWPWVKKEPKGFFRGSRTSSDRDSLIHLSRLRPDIVDALYTKNQAWKSIKDSLNVLPAEITPLESHCSFKYLFNFRGVAASFRYKHLFLCGSLVFQVDSKWVEFFYDSLIPWVHYVPVSSSCDNVEELIEFMKTNDGLAQTIAERGYRFILDNLTPDSIVCYWKFLILNYAKIMKWTPVRIPHYSPVTQSS